MSKLDYTAQARTLRAVRKAGGLCPFCGEPAAFKRVRCAKCQSVRRRIQTARSARFVRKGLCRCGGLPRPGRMSCDGCADRVATSALALKVLAINHYGGKCACCGETTVEFLTFDHIGGWGAAHRREDRLVLHIFRWLRKHGYPPGFRILCANCHMATDGGKQCPHERETKMAPEAPNLGVHDGS